MCVCVCECVCVCVWCLQIKSKTREFRSRQGKIRQCFEMNCVYLRIATSYNLLGTSLGAAPRGEKSAELRTLHADCGVSTPVSKGMD